MKEIRRVFPYTSEGKREYYIVRCTYHCAQRTTERLHMTPDTLLDSVSRTLAGIAVKNGWNKKPWRESDGESRTAFIRMEANGQDLVLVCAMAVDQLSIETVYLYYDGIYVDLNDEPYTVTGKKVTRGIKGSREKN